jgi:hypothetical protein
MISFTRLLCSLGLLTRYLKDISWLEITYTMNQETMMKATKRRLPERRPNCLGLTGDWYGSRRSTIAWKSKTSPNWAYAITCLLYLIIILSFFAFIFHQEWITGQILNVSWSYIKEAFLAPSSFIYHWLRKVLSFFNFLHRPFFQVLCLIIKELAKVTHVFYFFHTFFEFLNLL